MFSYIAIPRALGRPEALVTRMIIYPEAPAGAQLGELDSLDNRKDYLCNKYMTQMKSPSHTLHHLLPSPLLNEPK